MQIFKSFNDRRSAKKSEKAVSNWKAAKAQSSHDAGAWSGKTDSNWNTPSSTRSVEFNTAKDVNW